MVKASLHNPIGEKSIEAELIIDTGFQGGVLLPLRTYISLGLNLFEEPKITAQRAIGNVVEFRVSRVLIEVTDLKLMCTAYTMLRVKKPLLGREVLKKTGLLYKPPKKLKLRILES